MLYMSVITSCRYLLEAVAELAQRHGRKRAFGIHDECALFEAVQVTHHDQQVGRRLDGQEARSRYIHT